MIPIFLQKIPVASRRGVRVSFKRSRCLSPLMINVDWSRPTLLVNRWSITRFVLRRLLLVFILRIPFVFLIIGPRRNLVVVVVKKPVLRRGWSCRHTFMPGLTPFGSILRNSARSRRRTPMVPKLLFLALITFNCRFLTRRWSRTTDLSRDLPWGSLPVTQNWSKWLCPRKSR